MSYKHLIFSSIFILMPTLPFAASQPINTGFIRSRALRRRGDSIITIVNNCPYTVWAAAALLDPSGDFYGDGERLNHGDISALIIPIGNWSGRVWGRTNCSFDDSGRGNCETGDCGGILGCEGYGAPPHTVAEISLGARYDILQISLLIGFNIPVKISPSTASSRCSGQARCTHDINRECPAVLRAPGGCHNPCTVFKTDEYCCFNSSTNCEATNYSKVFKDLCPFASSYPKDDQGSVLKCPGGTSYDVVFCPS